MRDKITVIFAIVLLLIGLGEAYSACAQPQPPSIDGQLAEGEYANRYLAESIGMELHWTIEDEYLYLALKAPTRGWLAIAWDPTGPIMEGEDILIGYIREKELFLQDYYAHTSVSHANDVSLGGRDDVLEASGSEDENFTIIEFRRKLDTKDKFDRPLTRGIHTVQLAYAPNDDFLTYHGEKRTVVNIDFFAGSAQSSGLFARPRSPEASGNPIRAWLLTVITGVALISGLSVAYLLWPARERS